MYELIPHSDHPPDAVKWVSASLSRDGQYILANYGVDVNPADLLLPTPAKPYRTGDLWRTTCFELFIADGDKSYREFNFSPSSQWAAYKFDDYRRNMVDLELDETPQIWFTDEGNGILLGVRLRLSDLAEGACIGLSAVIEEEGGHKSYWALAHADGPPDFHNRDCFVAHLPPLKPA